MRLSIRSRMMLYIAAPLLLIFTGSSVYNTIQYNSWVKSGVEQRMTALAKFYANQLEARLNEVEVLAESTARIVETYPNLSSEQIYSQLENNLKQSPQAYGGVICFEPYKYDPSLRLYCPYVHRNSTSEAEQPPLVRMDVGRDSYDYTDPQWQWWYQPRKLNHPIWTEPYFDEGAGDILMSTYATPFYKEGIFHGITTLDISLEALEEMLPLELEAGLNFSVISPSGLFVFNSDKSLIKKSAYELIEAGRQPQQAKLLSQILSEPQSFIKASQWLGRDNQWLFNIKLNSSEWHFILEVDQNYALSEAIAKRNRDILKVVLLLALMAAVIWLTSKRFTKPIQELTDAAERMAEGELEHRITINSRDEIASLGNSFVRMSQAIGEKVYTIEKQNLELLEYQQSLEDKVSERTRELSLAKNQAEEANKAKSTFLANMSHELRTPMNAVLGFSQLMIQDSNLSANQKNTLNIINDSGEHLLDLINDVLDISKIEAGKVNLVEDNFSLPSVLHSVESMFRLKAEEKQLKLRFEIPENMPDMVVGDRNKVRQIIVNLIGNAIKFTDQGGILLKLDFSERRMDHLFEIMVVDSGKGVAPEDHEKIFSAFAQSYAGEKTQNSTGLGLAISRHYARMMGGDIILRSDTNPGSTFIFKIPLRLGCKTRTAEHNTAIAIEGEQRPHILVADDIGNNRLLIDGILSPLGFTLSFAENGREALNQLSEHQQTDHPIELILMDIVMPEMDGIEAIHAIKETPEWSDIPIIALSASVFENQRIETISEGADRFLKKPLIQEELLDAIASLLQLQFRYQQSSPAQAPEPSEVSPETLSSAKIMIVDDNKVNRLVAKGLLEKSGYSCVEAESGQQALSLVEQELPGLILMDRYMPEMDGLETIKVLRQRDHQVPIAIFSSEDREVDFDLCQQLNVTEYVNKPIIREELFSLVERYIRAVG